ncbi:MAG: hypothetical protein Q8O62_02885 [Aequorivita sp.]|nr:hypothetical protein [Aequorivita sp.]
MKTELLCLFILAVIYPTLAQELKMCGYQGYQTVEEVTSACDLQGATTSTDSSQDAEIVVDNILDKVGLFRNFLIEECDNINNALAVTKPLEGGDIDRYILYDEAFFQKVSASTGTDWGLTSILAHEVGHHLNGHTLKGGGSNHKVELQADEFSGFVLARMGCSLADAQSAVSKLLPDEASPTHPAKLDRLKAIEIGWNRGNGKTIKVKKIEEDIKNVVIENKEEVTVIDGVTAEQVIANYLDAIGGQEKIMEIKTFFQNQTVISQTLGAKGKDESKQKKELLYATPSKLLEIITPDSGKPIYSLTANNKVYRRSKPKKPWKQDLTTKNTSLEGNGIGYIPEFAALTNNINMKFLGAKKINGKDCFAIEFPEVEILRNIMIGIATQRSTKFYEISSGLLYYEEYTFQLKPDVNDPIAKLVAYNLTSTSKKFYSDYRLVDGVMFSFKQEESIIENSSFGNYNTEAITEYSEIKVNPTINPEDFDPTK